MKPYIHGGNQVQNHKIETNSELIYEDGSIWWTLFFIKIIGNDTLWFPFWPGWSHTFVEIDHEIMSTVILLPYAEAFKKGCCHLQAKVCERSTG